MIGFGDELALEVLLLERVVQVLERVEHGAEAVEVGAGVGRRRASGSAPGRCTASPRIGALGGSGSGSRSAEVGEHGLAGVVDDDDVGPQTPSSMAPAWCRACSASAICCSQP